MEIKELINKYPAPELYTKGSGIMWTDSHISKQLLHIHLDEKIDLASRNKKAISRTVEWILGRFREVFEYT